MPGTRVASICCRRGQCIGARFFWGSSNLVTGCGHVGEGAGGGQRAALSTGRAVARQRIVHMSIAFPPAQPVGDFSRCVLALA